jgi:hypothetical protein
MDLTGLVHDKRFNLTCRIHFSGNPTYQALRPGGKIGLCLSCLD